MASIKQTSPFLSLPQELRDLIYTHAINEILQWPSEFKEWHYRAKSPEPYHPDTPRNLLSHFPAHSPKPTWYSLLLCCQTTNKDIRHITQTTTRNGSIIPDMIPPISSSLSAMINLSLTSTTATTVWQKLPRHPRQISSLQITIQLAHIWDIGISTGAPQADNRIIRALFYLIRQYCNFGPHLTRTTPLSRPLHLETVVLTIEPSSSAEESRYFFGDPAQRLATIQGVLLMWLGMFARSGLLCGSVRWIVLDCDCVYEVGVRPVTFAITDHGADRETFRELGYEWDESGKEVVD